MSIQNRIANNAKRFANGLVKGKLKGKKAKKAMVKPGEPEPEPGKLVVPEPEQYRVPKYKSKIPAISPKFRRLR